MDESAAACQQSGCLVRINRLFVRKRPLLAFAGGRPSFYRQSAFERHSGTRIQPATGSQAPFSPRLLTRLQVLLSPQAAATLARLQVSGESKREIIERALLELERSVTE